MAVKGRKPGSKNGMPNLKKVCFYCEGSGRHFGKPCPACDSTGEEIVRKQMQKVHNAKNKLPLNYNLDPLKEVQQ